MTDNPLSSDSNESSKPELTQRQLEKHMEQVFLADRAATTRLGRISTAAWCASMALFTGGGLLAVLIRQQSDNEGLRIAMVMMSIPGLFALLLGVVTAVLWSRRSQRLTLETLQDRLGRLEKLLRD